MSAAEIKPAGYYGLERADVVAELPRPIGRALDLGCGEGGVGRSLRAAGATEIVGVEVVPEAAERARASLDQVVVGTVEDALRTGAVAGPFDTICCYDVLEHLVDPPAVLRDLRGLAAPGGRLHISIPNARHFSLVKDLVFRGTFGYAEYGHRDATHLRWYTRKDLVALVADAGWTVQWTRAPAFLGRDRHADRLTLGRAREFITLQWHLLAVAL
jgi:O-antigen biosynthesis protein